MVKFPALLPLLLCGCVATGNAPAPSPAALIAGLLPVVEAFADGAVRLHLTTALAERAPALLAVLDTGGGADGRPDGTVSLDELRGADLTDPALVTVLLLTIEKLFRD